MRPWQNISGSPSDAKKSASIRWRSWFFKPTREAAFWCAAVLAAMHHGRFNAYAAYALLSLLIVLVVFLLFQTS